VSAAPPPDWWSGCLRRREAAIHRCVDLITKPIKTVKYQTISALKAAENVLITFGPSVTLWVGQSTGVPI
jgi:hypothetical protein